MVELAMPIVGRATSANTREQLICSSWYERRRRYLATDAVVDALNGNDVVLTDLASTEIYGRQGLDRIINTGGGVMTAYGGQGTDLIQGGTTSDHLYGEDDGDLLAGGNFEFMPSEGKFVLSSMD